MRTKAPRLSSGESHVRDQARSPHNAYGDECIRRRDDNAAARRRSAGCGSRHAAGARRVRDPRRLRADIDSAIADLPTGDVHVRDGAIVAVAPRIEAPSAISIDGKGMICMPGMVETHWHHWTNILRSFMRAEDPRGPSSPSLQSTDRITRRRSATAARASALPKRCRPASPPRKTGTTTPAATSMPRPRCAPCTTSAFAAASPYGTPQGHPNDKPMDFAGLERAKRDWSKEDGLLLLAICSRSINNANAGTRGTISPDVAKMEWTRAREQGLPITMHTSGVGGIKVLDEASLARPRCATGSSAQHDRRGARGAGAKRHELQHLPGRRSPPSGRRNSVRRNA